MRSSRLSVSLFASVFIVLFSQGSAAQLVDVSDCRVLEDRVERFACMEDLLDSLEPAAAVAPPVAQPPVEASQPSAPPAVSAQPVAPKAPAVQTADSSSAATEVENFGKQPGSGSARIVQSETDQDVLLDTVAGVEQFLPNRWDITLASGQQWRQMTSRRFLLKKGDTVKIYPTMFGGSYRMSAERLNGYIQVERIK